MSLATRPVASVPNDLESFWVPFTPNRAFKKAPRLFVGARDMHYVTSDGRQVLDGTAGLWCCNAGHCRPRISAAIVICNGELTAMPVPFSISTRMSATSCRVIKKKIVGGNTARNSSLSFSSTLCMALSPYVQF